MSVNRWMFMKTDGYSAKLTWRLIVVWFCANLLSQTLYIGKYGVPYEADLILTGLGPFAGLIVALEILVWGFISLYLINKWKRSKNTQLHVGLSKQLNNS